MVARYYQDELLYLRDAGRAFAEANPEAAPFLAEAGADPSVERLLEGFAFLTGRLREKIDDELPELTRSLLETFFPHYLRPVPALTIMQCRPMPKAFTQVVRIPRGAIVDSVPVDGTRCRFVTSAAVDVVPVRIESVDLERGVEPSIRVRLAMLHGNSFARLEQDRLRLQLAGPPQITRHLFLCLAAYLRHTEVVAEVNDRMRTERLAGTGVCPVGLSESESILAPGGSDYLGYNIMHEYFAFPDKFLAVEVMGLRACRLLEETGRFELVFHLESMPDALPEVDEKNLLLNCAPAVNLFAHHADPIRLDGTRDEYRLRPSGDDARHYHIYGIESVTGLGAGRSRAYHPLFHYQEQGDIGSCFYQLRQHDDPRGGMAYDLVVRHGPEAWDQLEGVTLSIALRCTNADLPMALDVDDISRVVEGVPATVRMRNISKPTAVVPPPPDGDLHWRLLGHLNINGTSLADVETLRSLINTYNFKSHVNRHERQANERLKQGIRAVQARGEKRLYEGAFIAGTHVEIELDEDCFASMGEIHLFGRVLDELFAQFVALNAFVRLSIRGARTGETFTWPARLGRRTTI